MTSTLEKIQANEAAVRQLSNSNIEISRRIMAMDQAQLSMSKTLAAVSEVLIEKGVISDQDVMDKLRDAEDQSSEKQINQLVESGVLAEGAEITNSSIVVLQQQSEEKIIANYYVVEMNSRVVAAPLKELLMGKTVGDEFDWEADETVEIECKILRVLENKSISKGE